VLVGGENEGCIMNPIAEETPDTPRLKRVPAAKAVTAVKPSVQSSRHKRKSERRIVPLDRQSCKLKVGGKVLSASLVNESRGGFAIWTDSVDSLKIGEKLRLHTDQGWFTARIAYIREVAKSQDAQSKCDAWFQLGLKKTGGLLCLLDPETLSSEGTAMTAEAETVEKCSIRTKKKLEAAIAEEISHFEQEVLGHKPGKVFACLMGDLLVVRFQSVFAEAKQQLAELLPVERCQGVLNDLKEIQNHLIDVTRPVIEAMIEKITAVKVVAAKHEINATTGEKVFLFTLARSPDCLE
jgi:uncharacterized protein YbcI